MQRPTGPFETMPKRKGKADTETNSQPDAADNESQDGDANANAERFAAVLEQTLTRLLKKPNATITPFNKAMAKQQLQAVIKNQLQHGDVYDLFKVTSYLRIVERMANDDNFFCCATLLHSEFPDTTIKVLCNNHILEAADNGQIMSRKEWKELCRAICTTLLGSDREVTNQSRQWLADCESRGLREGLESYYGRFRAMLHPTMWLRECFDKPTTGKWMIGTAELFIEKFNSPMAQVIVIDMPKTHSLHDIFFKLQKLTRIITRDDDSRAPR